MTIRTCVGVLTRDVTIALSTETQASLILTASAGIPSVLDVVKNHIDHVIAR